MNQHLPVAAVRPASAFLVQLQWLGTRAFARPLREAGFTPCSARCLPSQTSHFRFSCYALPDDPNSFIFPATVVLIASRAGPMYLRGSYSSGLAASASRTAFAEEI